MKNQENKLGEVVLYRTKDGQTALDVRLAGDTMWLSQKQMGELFDKNVRTISEHIRNVFKEKKLEAMTGDQGRGLVDVISRYTRTFLLLQRYDEGLLTEACSTCELRRLFTVIPAQAGIQ